MVHQQVHKFLEEVRLLGTEEAASNLVHGLLQLGNTVVVLRGVVSVQDKGQCLKHAVLIDARSRLFLSLLS